jgi:hypothetical protein
MSRTTARFSNPITADTIIVGISRQQQKWMMPALAFAALLLSAHADSSAKEAKNSPAKVEAIEGSDVSRITLVEQASQRLGIETAPVRQMSIAALGTGGGTSEMRIAIPYSAVIYDTTGKAWAYTSPEPLVYVREPISIDYTEGDLTVLLAGPALGMQVVVIGAAELYGAETGVK